MKHTNTLEMSSGITHSSRKGSWQIDFNRLDEILAWVAGYDASIYDNDWWWE